MNEPTTRDDERQDEAQATMPQGAEMELRERVTVLEEDIETVRQATRGFALGALCVACGLLLLVIIRTRGGAA